jgi:hypothetical protein
MAGQLTSQAQNSRKNGPSQTAVSLRSKNNSVAGTTPGLANYLMQQTPSGMQGYSTNPDQESRHRRTSSKQMDKQTPSKTGSQSRDLQMKQQYINPQKVYEARGRVGQSQQLQGGFSNPKATSLVSQSLDSSLQMHMQKRKASNDESRFKNQSRLSHNGHMAPFLDQSLDFQTVLGQPSKLLKDKTNITNLPGQDLNRPKTSTGLRGGINKITEDQQQQNTQIPSTIVNNLPTKPTSKNQSTFSGKLDKNDGLRQQLRRSFDANAQPAKAPAPMRDIPNRPHSS